MKMRLHYRATRVIAQVGLVLALLLTSAFGATTLLPQGEQTFLDNNGAPCVGCSVYYYIPSTTTFKNTWKDGGQSVLNTNPVITDSAGRVIVYGVGQYRQLVKDSLGNTIWDQLTTDTSAFNSTFWAGLAAGTPNAITISDSGFNATDGTVVNFTAIATNTGPSTLNPSSFGAIPILKDTTAGPVALTGGEIVQTNPISVIYRASDAAFHLLNTVIASASGATSPLCGATNLKIANDSGTPNSIISITADQVVTQSAAGLVVNRSSISASVNITQGNVTSTIGGMDGEVPGTSNWLYIWLIDNGSSSSAIASSATGFGLSPVLPSTYIYKCRVGALRVDNTGVLLRTIQRGRVTQYTVVPASNTPAYPTVASGSNAGVMTATPIGAFTPPTASQIGMIAGQTSGGSAVEVNVAMNANGAFAIDGSNVFTFSQGAGTSMTLQTSFFGLLEGPNVYYGSSGAAGILRATGWVDQVNTN